MVGAPRCALRLHRGDLRVPARAFGVGMPFFCYVPSLASRYEGSTRAPVIPPLRIPDSRGRYVGLAASIAVHLLLLALLVSQGERWWSRAPAPADAASSGESSSRGGGGGNRVAYITLPLPPEPAPMVTEAPRPVRVPKPVAVPVPDQVPTAAPAAEVVDTQPAEPAAPVVGSDGSGKGPGPAGGIAGGGQGRRSGADSGLGPGGGRARPPEPRDMAFPFDNPPKELRGVSLSVTFWVRIDGGVERYQVVPEIKDRDYARKFDEVMRVFRFTPARAPDGTRVAGITKISFTLPGKSSS
jgi:hypothetical protein